MLRLDLETRTTEFSSSCDAVSLGFKLLNTVEGIEDNNIEDHENVKPRDVSESIEKSRLSSPPPLEVSNKIATMENSQQSPPMYPNDSSSQQPKVQQMTDLSNCTVNNNNNTNTSNNNNPSNASTNMANPLRIKHFAEHSDRELAELATQEISLDLQGLIDDTHFPDDNLFGDLMDTAKKNDMYGMGAMGRGGAGSVSTPGSSGQNSPGSEGQNSPPAYQQAHQQAHYRNTLAYMPGSVHHGANYGQQQQQQHHPHHPQVGNILV